MTRTRPQGAEDILQLAVGVGHDRHAYRDTLYKAGSRLSHGLEGLDNSQCGRTIVASVERSKNKVGEVHNMVVPEHAFGLVVYLLAYALQA